MRFLSASIIFLALTGCASLNSEEHNTTKSTLTIQKKCGCAGHESCAAMTNCGVCCTPESCKCKEITQK